MCRFSRLLRTPFNKKACVTSRNGLALHGLALLSGALLTGALLAGVSGAAFAGPLSLAETNPPRDTIFDYALRDQPAVEAPDASVQMPARLRRQIVEYHGREAPGTIIVDTPNTYLFLILPGGRAMRYGIGVGRAGFTWAGSQKIARKAEWPDWYPPREMIARQPYLPRFVAGGESNPLGARALYLGNTEYRIHGTNQPETIGHNVSSGCIRLLNDDVIDLYSRVGVGTKVVVLPMSARAEMARETRVASVNRAPSARTAATFTPVSTSSVNHGNRVRARGLY